MIQRATRAGLVLAVMLAAGAVWAQSARPDRQLSTVSQEAWQLAEQGKLESAWGKVLGVPEPAADNPRVLALRRDNGADYKILSAEAAVEYGLADLWFIARVHKSAPVSREMVLNHVAQHTLGLPKSY